MSIDWLSAAFAIAAVSTLVTGIVIVRLIMSRRGPDAVESWREWPRPVRYLCGEECSIWKCLGIEAAKPDLRDFKYGRDTVCKMVELDASGATLILPHHASAYFTRPGNHLVLAAPILTRWRFVRIGGVIRRVVPTGEGPKVRVRFASLRRIQRVYLNRRVTELAVEQRNTWLARRGRCPN